MTDKKIKTFHEFWPHYLRLHSQPVTRAIHYAGTVAGIAGAGVLAVVNPPLIPLVLIPVYGALFASHPIFEGNSPATIKNPLMSVGGDFKMLGYWLTGRLKGEYERHGLDYSGRVRSVAGNDNVTVSASSPAPKASPLPPGGSLQRSFGHKPEVAEKSSQSGPTAKKDHGPR